MKNPVAIIAGEPNSISSEIIFKSWKSKEKYSKRPFFIIGSIKLLNLQKKKLKYRIKIKKIYKNFKIEHLQGKELPVFDINYNQKTPFKKISTNSNKYIFECFKTALQFVKKEKILGIINCPVSKEYLFKNKYQGITEYISRLSGYKGKEVMLIYNKELAVSPITTHIPVSQINKKINQSEITKKVKTINNFYIKFLNKKPNIAILGLNPHNYSTFKNFEEKKIIQKAINSLRSLKIKIIGPVSTDTSFMAFQRKNFDVIIGMYHDQVLTPFKALYNFNAINITLGLPFLRVSPDHGVAKNIAGKNEANPKSLIEAIKFFNNIK